MWSRLGAVRLPIDCKTVVLAVRHGTEAALVSRCITIPMQKGRGHAAIRT